MNSIFAIVLIGTFVSLTSGAGVKAAKKYPMPLTNMFQTTYHHSVEDAFKCSTIPSNLDAKIAEFSAVIIGAANHLANQVRHSPKKNWASLTQPLCLEKAVGDTWCAYFMLVADGCWKVNKDADFKKNVQTKFDQDVCTNIRAIDDPNSKGHPGRR